MSAKRNILVEMRGVRLQFADKVVLDGVNFSMQAEEILVIMGLSGSGKSTLLGLLMGLLKPNAGSVKFKGADLTKLSRPKLNEIRSHLGMVYQNAALMSSMSVSGNIRVPLQELTKNGTTEIESIVAQKLELVGLGDAKDKLPSELSGGMQKRAGLARALALDPELVLFDEPSAGLDPINNKLITDLIIDLREKHNVASIVVTHEMESAFAVATRMAFLHEGKILLEGTPDEFRNSDNPVISDFLLSYSNHWKSKE
jgi:phospholipid/cholesterol/gamma-HCH transport system ATP-binding protein